MKSSRRNTVLALLFIAATATGASWACGTSAPVEGTPTTGARLNPVKAVAATQGSISVTSVLSANIDAGDQVNMVPLTAGLIEKLFVDVGAEVQKGQMLAQLTQGTLQSQLRSAQAAFRDAQARLAALARPSAADLQSSTAAVTAAQAALDNASGKLDLLQNPSKADIATNEAAIRTAQANLETARIKLDQLTQPTATDVTAARATVASAASTWRAAQNTFDTAVRAAISTGGLNTGNADPTDVRFLYMGLQNVRAQLVRVQIAAGETPSPSLVQSIAAEESLSNSLYAQILASQSPFPLSLVASHASEESANASYVAALTKLKVLLSPDGNAVALLQQAIHVARIALDSARIKQEALLSPDARGIASVQNDIKTAQANLDTAVARLNALRNPSTTTALGTAQTAVDQAQASVDSLTTQIGQTEVRAPFDGVVTQRLIAPGAFASTAAAVFVLSSKASVLTVSVGESSVANLKEGQMLNVTAPALAGKILQLPIARIATSANKAAHTFDVQALVDPGTGLRPGMSAQVSILTRKDGVVLVPREAVFQQAGQAMVFTLANGILKLKPVVVGLTDARSAEIVSGLQRNELVVTSPQNLLKDGGPAAAQPDPTPVAPAAQATPGAGQGQGAPPGGAGRPN